MNRTIAKSVRVLRIWGAIALLFGSVPVASVHAFVLATYDLDSLVYVSDEIVEGHVTAGQLKIAAVDAGDPRVGAVINVNWDEPFMKATGFFSYRQINSDDRLILFLNRPGAAGEISTASHQVVMSGMKVISRGRVYGFWQGNNPGPLVAELNSEMSRLRWPTVVEFRKSIRSSQARVKAWRAQFGAPLRAADVSWLLPLIQERSGPGSNGGDFDLWHADAILNDATQRLFKLQNFEALERAMTINRGLSSKLGSGFSSPNGRDYLLRRIADQTVPNEIRVRLADAVQWAGVVYHSDSDEAATRPGVTPGDPDGKNASYLRRIAQLAVSVCQTDPESCMALIRAMPAYPPDDQDQQLQLDVRDAWDVLERLYRGPSTPESVGYEIENIAGRTSMAQYQRLGSKCGPILNRAYPADANIYAPPAVPSVILNYDYSWLAPAQVTSTELVFQPMNGGQELTASSNMIAGSHGTVGSSGWGGGQMVPLPARLHPGRYRMFYRFLDGTKAISEGHGFETTLPQSVAPQAVAPPSGIYQRPATIMHPLRVPPRRMVIGSISVLTAIIALPPIIKSRRKRWRFAQGLCIRCGYDLRASQVRCPECGVALPQQLRSGMWKHRLALGLLVPSIGVFVAVVIAWPISHYATFSINRAAPKGTHSIYAANGAIVLEANGDPGDWNWSYEHDGRGALPRSSAEAGATADFHFAGAEYSREAGIIVLPCWLLAALATASGAFAFFGQKQVKGSS